MPAHGLCSTFYRVRVPYTMPAKIKPLRGFPRVLDFAPLIPSLMPLQHACNQKGHCCPCAVVFLVKVSLVSASVGI